MRLRRDAHDHNVAGAFAHAHCEHGARVALEANLALQQARIDDLEARLAAGHGASSEAADARGVIGPFEPVVHTEFSVQLMGTPRGVHFKASPGTRFAKVMHAACDKLDVAQQTASFVFPTNETIAASDLGYRTVGGLGIVQGSVVKMFATPTHAEVLHPLTVQPRHGVDVTLADFLIRERSMR